MEKPDKFYRLTQDLALFFIDAGASFCLPKDETDRVYIVYSDSSYINKTFFLPLSWVEQRKDLFREEK